MDEWVSWRARLAKSNINILNISDEWVVFEFTYHPKAGAFKWCKTALPYMWDNFQDMAEELLDEVLKLRKELER